MVRPDVHGLERLEDLQLRAPTGACCVVTAEVLREHDLEMAARQDEAVVQALQLRRKQRRPSARRTPGGSHWARSVRSLLRPQREADPT
jgi:hypothetical protein